MGDSSYRLFNWTAKKLHSRLLALGATPLLELAEADDQDRNGSMSSFPSDWLDSIHWIGLDWTGPDQVLDPWSERLWEALLARYPLPPTLQVLPAAQLYVVQQHRDTLWERPL